MAKGKTPADVDPARIVDLGPAERLIDGSDVVTLLIPDVPQKRAIEIARACAQAILAAEGWTEAEAAEMTRRVGDHIERLVRSIDFEPGHEPERAARPRGERDDDIPL